MTLSRALIPISIAIVCASGAFAQGNSGDPPGKTRIQTELVAFTVQGFDPVRIVRPLGPFILAIYNTTRLPSLQNGSDPPARQAEELQAFEIGKERHATT